MLMHPVIRIAWWGIVVATISFFSYVFFASKIVSAADADLNQVIIRETIDHGAVVLHGMVFVPSECHDLRTKTLNLDDGRFALVFESWQQPYRDCSLSATPRGFSVTAFIPADTKIVAFKDAEEIPVKVIQDPVR